MIMKYLPLSFSVLLALSPAWVQAADNVQKCLNLTDATARLACYDRLHHHQPTAADTALQPPSEVTATTRSVLDLEKTLNHSIEKREAQVVLAEAPNTVSSRTPLSELYDLDENSESGLLTVREHNPMYIMPCWYNTSPNLYPSSPSRGVTDNDIQSKQKHLEGKFQFSFKTKVMQDLFKTKADLWMGYTQQSNWQMYNWGSDSAPFRNNDYQPEIFLTQPVKADLPWGGKLRMLGAGFVHHSNGQDRPASRSWNRIYAMAGMEWGKLTVQPRLWARLDPSKDSQDDNPDITDYYGFGDIKTSYNFDEKRSLTSTLRYNPFHNKGAIELAYTFPIKGKLKGFVQGFHGYGENLLDYNHKQTGIGMGLMFQGWDGL